MNDQNNQGGIDRRAFIGGMAATAAGIAIAGCKHGSKGAATLSVGGLPVTCNLTLPIATKARQLALDAGKATGTGFEFSRYSGWPELKESLMSGQLQAAYMLAPLVMDLSTRKIPIKIVSLGHRSGAVIMVRTDSGYKTMKDLAGKRVAIPNRFAVDYLFLRRMLAKQGMSPTDVEIMEMAPPDMPPALYAKAVDAYCTGEPFGAAAQKAGYAVPLAMTRDEWPSYICCVLTVRDELIRDQRPVVQALVDYVAGAGAWLDKAPQNRTKASELAAGRQYFNQDPKIIQFVMENPPDRVTYGDMRLIKTEFDELMKLEVAAGVFKQEVPYEQYVDESFIQAAKPADILI